MSDLEQAARLALDALVVSGLSRTIQMNQKAIDLAIKILRAALNRQAEPVAIVQHRKQHCADWYDCPADHEDGGGPYEERVLYTHPHEPVRISLPQQPEPVFEIGFGWLVAADKYPRGTKLYSAPQQKQAEPVEYVFTPVGQRLPAPPDPMPVISAIEDGASFDVLEALAADFRKGLK